MKKTTSMLATLAVVTSLALTGCGSQASTSSKNSNSSDNKSSTAPAPNAKTLRLAYIMAPGGPADDGAKKFKEIVEQKSNGSLKVSLNPSAQLGGEKDVMEALKLGSIELALTGDGPIGMFVPQYSALQMPYIFRDMDHLHKVLDGPIGKDLAADLLKTQASRVLDYWDRGPRMLTAKKEIKTPDDLKGVKIRVPEVPMSTEAWKAIGGSPTPIPLAELYNSLQQGLVVAQENPLELIYTSHYDEVQTYVMRTNHVYLPYIFSISEKVFQGLSPDQQKIVQEAALEAGKLEKKLTADSEKDFEQKLQAKGMKFVEVDRKLFEDKVKPVISKFEKDWKKGLYDQIVNTK
jgi:TRAP-type transport system periplasmic protein